MLTSFLGLTNGHLTVCVFTAAPKGYKVSCIANNLNNILSFCCESDIYLCGFLKAPEQNALGNMLVMFLLGGIFAGVSLGWLWIIGNGSF